MPLKKPAAPTKSVKAPAKAPAKAAPTKGTIKKKAVEVEPEEEEEEEEEVAAVEISRNSDIELTVHRSFTYRYANGALDNYVATAKITLTPEMDLDDVQSEVNAARVATALAIGADYAADGEAIAVGMPSPLEEPAPSSSKSGGSAAKPAAKKASSGGGGNSGSNANYSVADKKALWEKFKEDAEEAGGFPEDGWWDNTDGHQYPGVKPKQSVIDELEIEVDEIKPLYLKNAPKDIQAMFEE